VGKVRLYDDSACQSQFSVNDLSSSGGQCINLFPAGKAIGAKAITDLSYTAGTCKPFGGEPGGKAYEDPKEPEDIVTFCCRAPFDDVDE
jgi:hypothetical protein